MPPVGPAPPPACLPSSPATLPEGLSSPEPAVLTLPRPCSSPSSATTAASAQPEPPCGWDRNPDSHSLWRRFQKPEVAGKDSQLYGACSSGPSPELSRFFQMSYKGCRTRHRCARPRASCRCPWRPVLGPEATSRWRILPGSLGAGTSSPRPRPGRPRPGGRH